MVELNYSDFPTNPEIRAKIEARISGNLELVDDIVGEHDKLAARYMFSTMSHLEQIAVFASKRGDGIDGQLEDELVHRETFALIASMHGGAVEPVKQVQDLIDFLQSLDGETSLAALNVVAESWLGTVFGHIGRSGFCRDLFKSIEDDELRHVNDALSSAMPDPDEFIEVVRHLENLLMRISFSSDFMLPMIWIMGQEAVSRMGLALCDAHERACSHMGIEPDLEDMRLSARSMRLLDRTAPQPIDMNEWERTKAEAWKTAAPQHCYFDIVTDETNPIKLQTKVISCVGKILARYPKLRNVIRRDQLFRSDSIVVGLRSLYDDNKVITLWVARPQKYSWKRIVRILSKQNRRVKSEPYEPYDGLVSLSRNLMPIYPPHRSCCVVTYNGDFGGLFGTGPLSDVEGVPMVVTLGKPHKKFVDIDGVPSWENVVTTCITADHRTVDGKDIGIMAEELIKEMKRV